MRKLIIIALFTLVSLTWGTTWLAMQIAVETITPIFATGIRFLFAAPILIGIAWATKTPLIFPAGQRKLQILIGIFYFAIPFTLMIYGEKYVSSGLASIIFANMPVAVLIASMLLLKERINVVQIVGLIVSIAALSLILIGESKTNANSQWQGILVLVLAVVMHAVMYAQCKKRCCKVPVITFNALPCLMASIILLVGGWFVEKPQIEHFSTLSLAATVYLGTFAGVFGILCYFSLQQKATAFQASLVFLVFPLIALSLENYVYGYSLSRHSLLLIFPLVVGIFITVTGNHFVSLKSSEKMSH